MLPPTQSTQVATLGGDDDDRALLAQLLALDPQNAVGQMLQTRVDTQPGTPLSPDLRAVVIELRDQAGERKAREILDREDFRAVLCPALSTLSNDLSGMLNVVVGGLFTLAAAGVAAIPLVPTLAAWIVLLIARAGVASICKGFTATA